MDTRWKLDVNRWTLDGHSTDTRHSAIDTRWDWWCRMKLFVLLIAVLVIMEVQISHAEPAGLDVVQRGDVDCYTNESDWNCNVRDYSSPRDLGTNKILRLQ